MSGLLVYFDETQRRDLIREEIEGTYEPFSDALSVKDWELERTSIALLAFSESTIDYIALARKGRRVATSKCRIEFSGMVNLDSISVESVESRLSERIRPHFIKASRGTGGLVPEKTWQALIDVITKERPQLAGDIDRLMSLRRYSGYRLGGPIAELFLQEREALGAALDIFSGNNKLRNSVLSEWAPREASMSEVNEQNSTARLLEGKGGGSSFLTRIPKRFLQEESALQHDLFSWPGMTPIHISGTSVFTQGERRLDVIYANRNSLEHTLGVDLIYYNEAYDSYVLVQYKLMREEAEQMCYRPDPQLSAELARMDSIYKAYQRKIAIQSHGEFRLNDDGFMFKLVPNQGLRPASGELIKGMYLPREYMCFLIGPNGPKGTKGAPLLSFAGVQRYLTNSEFVAAVNSGWIGTSGEQSKRVKDLVRQYYETGRALLIAYESSTSSNG